MDRRLRARRATDGLLLVWSIVGLVGLGVLEDAKPAAESALARAVRRAAGLVRLRLALPVRTAVAVGGGAGRRRAGAAAAQAGTDRPGWRSCVALALALLSARVLSGDWPSLTDLFATDGSQPSFPGGASGARGRGDHRHGGRRRRCRFAGSATWMITLGAAGTLAAGLASPFGTIAALVVGLAAAACARLAFGTSAGQPSVDEISDGLAALGAPVSDLHPIARQRTGVFTLLGVDDRQRSVLVRVYGRDAYDNQLLARLWRAALYRDARLSVGTSRARAAEREALVTFLLTAPACRRGVSSSSAGAATTTGCSRCRRLMVTAHWRTFRPSSSTIPRSPAPGSALERLHGANCAHGQIDPSTIVIGETVSRRSSTGRLRS